MRSHPPIAQTVKFDAPTDVHQPRPTFFEHHLEVPEVPVEDGTRVAPVSPHACLRWYGAEVLGVSVSDTVIGEVEVHYDPEEPGKYRLEHTEIVPEAVDKRPTSLRHVELVKRKAVLQHVRVYRYRLPWFYYFVVPHLVTALGVVMYMLCVMHTVRYPVTPWEWLVGEWNYPVLRALACAIVFPLWAPWWAWVVTFLTAYFVSRHWPWSVLSLRHCECLFSAPAVNSAVIMEDTELCWKHLINNAPKYVLRASCLPFDAATYARVRFDCQAVLSLLLGQDAYDCSSLRHAGFQLRGDWSPRDAQPAGSQAAPLSWEFDGLMDYCRQWVQSVRRLLSVCH